MNITVTNYIQKNILASRWNSYVDEIVGNHQCGFWHNIL